MTKNNSICDISNCALAYRHPGSDEPLCYDQHNPNNCPAMNNFKLSSDKENLVSTDLTFDMDCMNISEDDA